MLTSAAAFYDWFHDVTGTNINIPTTLELSNEDNADPNVFSYTNGNYFPIDGLSTQLIYVLTLEGQGYGNNQNGHNYWFTLEIHTQFTYRGGEVFSFTGDDDVW